jgi:hypothetical protein
MMAAKVTIIYCINRISLEPGAKKIIESNSISFYYNYIFRKNKFINKHFFVFVQKAFIFASGFSFKSILKSCRNLSKISCRQCPV